jgi:soluble lytic murein transglycosylase-like protein
MNWVVREWVECFMAFLVAAILTTALQIWLHTPMITSEQVVTAIIDDARPDMPDTALRFWRDTIVAAAKRTNLPAPVIAAKVAQESGYINRAVSPAGARGASQLMPMWTQAIDPIDVVANINKGCDVLAMEYAKSGGDMYRALRRYNGGPRNETTPATARYADAVLARIWRAEETLRKRQS